MVAIKAFPQLKGYIQLNSAEGESLPRQPLSGRASYTGGNLAADVDGRVQAP